MQPDISSIPQSLAQVLWLVLASSLGWVGGWLTRRRREPHEIAKMSAETRQINVNTDVSLIQAATTAIAKAERLQDERDHWERKATDVMLDLEESRNQNAEKDIRLRLHDAQIKRMELTLRTHNLNYDDTQDKPVTPLS